MSKKVEVLDSKISEVLEQLDQEIQSVLEKVVNSFSEKIILGYNTAAFLSKKMLITNNIKPLNDILQNYVKLFNGKEAGIESLSEALTLPFHNHEELSRELIVRYIAWNKIKIPYVSPEKLAGIFEFPTEDAPAYEEILKYARALSISSKFNYSKYFKTDNGTLEFSPEDEKDLLQQHTVYASEDQLTEILAAHLLCTSLCILKEDGYSFNELPEIDHRLMRLISPNETGRHVSVDIGKINGIGLEEHIEENKHFEFLGTNDAGLPRFFFDGKSYQYTCPRVGCPFTHSTMNPIDIKQLATEDPERFIKTSMRFIQIRSGVIEEIALPMVTQ